MFESGMKESVENQVEIIDFSFETVKRALEILYGRKIPPSSTMDEKMNLLQFFDKYDVQKFKVSVLKYILLMLYNH